MPSILPESDGPRVPLTPQVVVNVEQVLKFFDEKPSYTGNPATAIVAVLGEDLAAATLRHCLLANGATSVNVRTETVGTGRRKGPRLDRWIEADLKDDRRVLFQTEIKNWSAWAIRGITIPVNAPAKALNDYKDAYWKRRWDSHGRTFRSPDVAKVLVHMKPPPDCDGREILPLIIFWNPIGPRRSRFKQNQSQGGHLFSISEPTCNFTFDVPQSWPEERGFKELWVFVS